MSNNELYLENIGGNQYRFRYPRSIFDLEELVFDAIDLIEAEEIVEAKTILHSVVDTFPHHIEALHYLAVCLHHQGEKNIAFSTWLNAVNIGVMCFPSEVTMKDTTIEWGWMENRPFLRAYHAVGLALYERGDTKKALKVFNDLLSMNPFDNQGVRVLGIKANFDLKKPKAILDICNQFPDDNMAETIYGRLLVLYQLKRKGSGETLKQAIELLPLIAREIVRPNHSEIDDLLNSNSINDEEIEAIEYWQNFGKYWKNTQGAIEFIEEGIVKFGSENLRT